MKNGYELKVNLDNETLDIPKESSGAIHGIHEEERVVSQLGEKHKTKTEQS